MGWFSSYRRRRRIKRLVGKLPPLLKRDYGTRPPYTTMQVRATMDRHRLHERDIYFALAMMCENDAFRASLSASDPEYDYNHDHDYDAIRLELAASAFDGDVNFGFDDIAMASSDLACDWGSSGDAGGMDDGGFDDG